MNQEIRITHYYHSGFSVQAGDLLFVFDYWRGENEELPPAVRLYPEKLAAFRKVFVMISHEHVDHFDPIVYTWAKGAAVTYIVSSDMPVGSRGKRMAPGDEMELDPGVTLKAFDSTDLGISFLLDLHGFTLFHAGDLNFWHWRDESSLREIEEADEEFRKAVKPLTRERIDVAFFPVDPRQGTMFEAGANYFILSVKPRLLIPMHYFHRNEIAVEYARTASCRTTEVLAMPGMGDAILLKTDDTGYLDISFPQAGDEEPEKTDEETEPVQEDWEDPFAESDLPVEQLAHPSAQGVSTKEDNLST